MAHNKVELPRVASRAEWLAARKELLVREKKLPRGRAMRSASGICSRGRPTRSAAGCSTAFRRSRRRPHL